MGTIRSQFIESWKDRYPPAPPGCLSVSRLYRAHRGGSLKSPFWVAGQVSWIEKEEASQQVKIGLFESGAFLILSGLDPHWKLGDATVYGAEVLSPGDRVAFWVTESISEEELEGNRVVFTECQILTLQQRELRRFLPDLDHLSQWPQFLQLIRDFFRERGLREVFTPSLVPNPGMEPELIPFSTEFFWGRRVEQLYLPTSPEIHLKKMLASECGDLFEIKKCFRNEEVSDHHEPEFLMLEWYRSYADLKDIQIDLVDLISFLGEQHMIQESGVTVEQTSMSDLFDEYVGLSLTPDTSAEELKKILDRDKVPYLPADSWDDLFHLIFLTYIEPKIGWKNPLIVNDFPPSQAALARINERGWADRFELYWRGLEIANAFHELNDPEEQERRWKRDDQLREQKKRKDRYWDQEFLDSLSAGMPPSGGIALGLERLYMACRKELELPKIKAFSHKKRLDAE
ncbi:MAG: EF-P lysine aminoacylase GenX [Bdellovibrionales bacterium]|nr:EF-P lysine aminoacylase GenX [Bdellovibrionales bacterium]